MTKDNAKSEIILRLNPHRCMIKKVGIKDKGSAAAATKVARQSFKNSSTTITARAQPSINI